LLLLLNDGQQVHFVSAPNCRSHVQSLSTPLRCLQVLRVGKGDVCLTLTSGGCNAINMCLQGASSVTAVDCNPAQSALLELKATAIRCRSWDIPSPHARECVQAHCFPLVRQQQQQQALPG